MDRDESPISEMMVETLCLLSLFGLFLSSFIFSLFVRTVAG